MAPAAGRRIVDTALQVALAAVVISRQAAEAAGCVSALNCSLNGRCVGGSCLCDAPWTGPRCGTLEVGVAKPGGAYGWRPNRTSWGGNPVRGDDGLYHLYVAEIPGGLRNWGGQSQCAHATSPSVEGPYDRQGLVLGHECHNPSTLRHPQTGEYLMFHIGKGNLTGTTSSFLHTAGSPNGPWTAAKTAPNSCNNPAPAYHPNGTLFVVCNHLDITYAAADWEGEWAALRSMGHPGNGSRAGHYEDPYLYFDAAGHFHVIYHVFCLDPYEAHNECDSGHAYSADGFDWHFGADEPFSGLVKFSDGTSTRFATRERPHLVFADPGRHVPMGVFTAVSNQPIAPSCASCFKSACSQCKITAGRDWTFTQFEPFSNFNASAAAY